MKLANGYELTTTFWEDFSIADAFGINAVKDTWKRAFKEWKDNCVYITELCIVMNLKCWYHHKHNTVLSELYSDYYYQAREYALNHLKKDELMFFIETTD